VTFGGIAFTGGVLRITLYNYTTDDYTEVTFLLRFCVYIGRQIEEAWSYVIGKEMLPVNPLMEKLLEHDAYGSRPIFWVEL